MSPPTTDPFTGLVTAVRTAPPRLGRSRLVAVDGPSGSGKTTVADRLLVALTAAGERAALVRTDHFATWADPFGWWPRVEEVLAAVAAERSAHYLAMEWGDGEPVSRRPVTVPPVDVLILEGVSAARRAVADRLSLAVWVEMPDRNARLERAVARDGEAVRGPLRRWQVAEDAWFAADGTRQRADRVWPVD